MRSIIDNFQHPEPVDNHREDSKDNKDRGNGVRVNAIDSTR
jgi:hypothetical protein